MVGGPGEVLAETCQLVLFDPTLLSCAKKRRVEPPGRNCYFTLARKYTRVCGPLCDPSGSSQAMPALSGASTVLVSTLALVCNCTPVCSSYNDQTAEQQTYSSSPPQGIFALQKSLRGNCSGDGVPIAVGNAPPAQRNFQRKFALRQVGSSKFVVPPTIVRSKVRNNARLGKSLYRAAPGCQRDRGPFCFGKRPEEPLPRGSSGQLLRGGSTPRFFSQIRSMGSKPPGWQGTASQPLVLGPRVQPTPLLPAGSKKSPLTPRRAQKRTCLTAGPFLFPNYSSSSPAGASSARMDSEIRLCS